MSSLSSDFQTKLYDTDQVPSSQVYFMSKNVWNWNVNTFSNIEFFKGITYNTYYSSTEDPYLPDALSWLSNGNPEWSLISLDTEFSYHDDLEQVSLIQMAIQKKCIIIRVFPRKGEDDTNFDCLSTFMKNHKFLGKGIDTDLFVLGEYFNFDFSKHVCDIESYLSRKDQKSLNFTTMFQKYVKAPATLNYKTFGGRIDNYERARISNRLLLYASFDAVAVYETYLSILKIERKLHSILEANLRYQKTIPKEKRNEERKNKEELRIQMEKEVAALSPEQREAYEQLAIQNRIQSKLKRMRNAAPEVKESFIQHFKICPTVRQIYVAMQVEKKRSRKMHPE